MAKRRLKSVETAEAAEDAAMARIAKRAWEMRQEGMSITRIADSLEVTEDVVSTGLRISMRGTSDLVSQGAKTELLHMEISRLDHLQSSLWQAAVNGDRGAAETVLKIIAQRSKLLGLEEAQVEKVHTTLVVGDSEQYSDALRQIAQGKVLEYE